MSPTPIPRLLIAAPSSGQGKTTVTMGLIGALRRDGLEVAPFKVGPDYIDPGFHAVAAGRPCRNLDPHLCGEQRMVPLLRHGFHAPRPADLALIEGVMGLFDGRTGSNGFGSSAHVARLTGTPVVLVVDVSRASTTVAATVLGLTRFDPGVRVAGVILNRSYGGRTLTELITTIEGLGVRVLGSIPRATGVEVPSRHLGLVPAAELDSARAMVAAAVDLVGSHVDLALLREAATSAPPLSGTDWSPSAEVRPVAGKPVIAVATGRAFTFGYPEHAELLAAAGCQVVTFDPLSDPQLPSGTAGVYLGGGFPEVFSDRLSANARLRADLAAAVAAGVPTLAECAGLLYLSRSLDGAPMVGALAEHLPECSWTVPDGGFYTWVKLPEGLDAKEMLPRAVTARVAYVPGTAFYYDGSGADHMRLSFCYPTPERIREGVRRLADVVNREYEVHRTFGLSVDEPPHRQLDTFDAPAPDLS